MAIYICICLSYFYFSEFEVQLTTMDLALRPPSEQARRAVLVTYIFMPIKATQSKRARSFDISSKTDVG